MPSMPLSRAFAASLLLTAGCVVSAPAFAQQDVYSTNEDVIVNPVAGSGVLLYPGGKYGRVVHPLLQPGEPYPGTSLAPIHLHMPFRHVAHRVKKAPAQPQTAVASA